MHTKITYILISLLILVFTISGCASAGDKSQLLENNGTISNVGELKLNPDTYKGQGVVLYGKVERACPDDGCYFYLNDGTGTIYVDLKEIKSRISAKKNGVPIKVYGEFVNKGSSPYINAAQIELQ